MSNRGIPQHKRAMITEMYVRGDIAAQILAAANAEGEPVTWRQIKSMFLWLKIKRPVVNDMVSFRRVWSQERDAVIARWYPCGTATEAIIDLLNDLPGRKISFDAFRQRQKFLKILRTPYVPILIARALAIPKRDALDAVAWASRRGIDMTGSPLTVAARIADAVRVAA